MATNFINGIHKEDDTFITNKNGVAKEVIPVFKKIFYGKGKRFDEEEMAKLINYKIPLEIVEGLVEVMTKGILEWVIIKASGSNGFRAYFFEVA